MARFFAFIAACILVPGVMAPSLSAQVLVYELDISAAKGINFHPFEGGYFVAPLLGGNGTFLLTTSENGREYIEGSEGGRMFTGISGSGERKAVISAVTGGGTATGALVAQGDINHQLKVSNPTSTITAKVAKTLHGTLVSADDESSAESAGLDGSIGSAGTADVKASLEVDETNEVNKEGLTLEEAVEHLKLELARQGYSQAVADAEDETDDEGDVGNSGEIVTPSR